MYTKEDFPWYEEVKADRQDLDCFAKLRLLKKRGQLEDLTKVKEIKTREGYISLPRYFKIMEKWDYYESEFDKFYKRDYGKKDYLSERLGANSFWAVRVARFVCQNNLSDDPEKDLFICLRDNDILLYIEFLLAKDLYKSLFTLESPVKSSDLVFLDPKIRVTRENTKEFFPEMEDFREMYHDSVTARRLNETITLLLSPGVTKKDKIAIFNYLVNKESSGSNNSYFNTKYPKEITQRIWKSLLNQENILLLPKEIILKVYNNYKDTQPLNNGLGSIIKKITKSRVRPATEKYSKYKRITKVEQERLDLWIKKLNKQRRQH